MCKCIELANKKLQEKNTKIEDIWATLPGRVMGTVAIRTIKLNPRGRQGPIVLMATFCPFCGVKLDG